MSKKVYILLHEGVTITAYGSLKKAIAHITDTGLIHADNTNGISEAIKESGYWLDALGSSGFSIRAIVVR